MSHLMQLHGNFLCHQIIKVISNLRKDYNKIFQTLRMEKESIHARIASNNIYGEELVKFIKDQIPLLSKAASEIQEKKSITAVMEKNKQLKADLEFWKKRVIALEVMNGIEQVQLRENNCSAADNSPPSKIVDKTVVKKAASENIKSEDKSSKHLKKESKKEEKKEKNSKPAKPEKTNTEENKDINVSRLDLRIGRIINAKKHPDAESLYVEEIDVGEEKPRTVVSGLVKFVPLEEMQNRFVVVLCNLKPAKMRGITSEAMVMCASTPDKVEILCPPAGCAPGDKVTCEEYPGEPDALLNPKKKIFEQVAPDLKTNSDCEATFKSAVLKVAGKGVIKSLTLTNVQIK